jgi:hypothetical protein
VDGECRLPEFKLPPFERVIDELRQDPDTRIWRGARGDSLDKTDISAQFRKLPLEEAVASPFQISHFKLTHFYGPGQMLHGFEEKCLKPWLGRLEAAGFTYERYYPILFTSGRGSATNFHVDPTNVFVWQIYGRKIWYTTQDPHRWAPYEMRMNWRDTKRPPGITPEDLVLFEMGPGDMLWNAMLTPHWVDAADDQPALSINIAIDRLRLDGRLCPHEQELYDYVVARGEDPVVAGKPNGDY